MNELNIPAENQRLTDWTANKTNTSTFSKVHDLKGTVSLGQTEGQKLCKLQNLKLY